MRKSSTVRIVFAATLFVATLTLLSHFSESSGFFYFLMPGQVVSLLITGGHGGTNAEEMAGLIASFVVNTSAYSIVGAVLSLPSGQNGYKML